MMSGNDSIRAERKSTTEVSTLSVLLGRLRKRVLGIPLSEATFTSRGFRWHDAVARQRLERIGQIFLHGYHAALASEGLDVLVEELGAVEPDLIGFAYEGAAMGLSLLDAITPWRKDRLRSFLAGPGGAHAYMVHVGVGWTLARLNSRVDRAIKRLDSMGLDPLLRWLAIDGYGFHEGYFHWRHYVEDLARPKRLSGYAARVFDQGLGRSLWFIDGADADRIPSTIAAFPESRQADLWSGIGLASAYAGGAHRQALINLQIAAGPFRPHLAQGAAFAAKARQRAGNPACHTEMACELLCGLDADSAAEITDIALQALSSLGSEPEYELWRSRIRAHFYQEGKLKI
jgi:enediyne biosynthesis protein E3